MNDTATFGLPSETLDLIKNCFAQFPQIEWVKVYGSRALGTYHPGSDIDLAYSSKEDLTGKLLTMLDDLPTPYKFDLTHYNTLTHENLKDHINRVGIVLS